MPKYSALAALTGPNAAAGDLICLDDVSVTTSKKMTLDDLLQACLVATSKAVLDESDNEWLKFVTTASAVNEVTITNAATGNPAKIASTGGDTDIGLSVDGKGAGAIKLNTTGTGNVWIGTNLQHASAKAIVDVNGNESILFPATVASAVNEFTVSNAAAGAAPTVAATGGDTNISVDLVPKATGVVRARSLGLQKVTQTALTDSATLTIAQILTGIIDGTPTGAASYALPTAAAFVAGIPNARVGDSFTFLINNKSAGANTITVTAGGATIDGTVTVAQNVIRRFTTIVTNVTGSSEAYFVYGEGA